MYVAINVVALGVCSMKIDNEIAFTQKEINRFKSVGERRNNCLFTIIFLTVSGLFFGIGMMKIISSYAYMKAVGMGFVAFLSLNIEPNSSYQGALCLAREGVTGAILSIFISVIMIVLVIARRKQILWMRKTVHLIEAGKMRKDGTAANSV